MDSFIHDCVHELAQARERREKAQQDEDRIITQIIIHLEEVNNNAKEDT